MQPYVLLGPVTVHNTYQTSGDILKDSCTEVDLPTGH